MTQKKWPPKISKSSSFGSTRSNSIEGTLAPGTTSLPRLRRALSRGGRASAPSDSVSVRPCHSQLDHPSTELEELLKANDQRVLSLVSSQHEAMRADMVRQAQRQTEMFRLENEELRAQLATVVSDTGVSAKRADSGDAVAARDCQVAGEDGGTSECSLSAQNLDLRMAGGSSLSSKPPRPPFLWDMELNPPLPGEVVSPHAPVAGKRQNGHVLHDEFGEEANPKDASASHVEDAGSPTPSEAAQRRRTLRRRDKVLEADTPGHDKLILVFADAATMKDSAEVTSPRSSRRKVSTESKLIQKEAGPPEDFFLEEISPEVERSQSQFQKLEHFLQSGKFELLISALLCANVFFLALELQYHGATAGYHLSFYETPYPKEEDWAQIDTFFVAGDYVFTGLFFIDVAVRIAVLRSKFWSVPMNWIDFVVVLTSLVQLAITLPISPMFLRLLRVGKLTRSLRMVTSTNAVASLQLLVKCLASSVDMLCWSFIILIFIQCIAGMIIATLAKDYIADESKDQETRRAVFIYYGTFTRTFLTMFEILFANWAPACRVLVDNVSEWYSIFFLIYRCVIGFAVINVLNAVFVQQTLKAASSDEELSFKQRQKDQVKYAQKVKKLFQSMDVSDDGLITFDEFALLVEDPKLKFWMGQLELEYHDLLGLFEMLDDGDGEISMDEFVEGAGRLKGTAKTIDIWRLETKLEIMLTRLLTNTSQPLQPFLSTERPDLDLDQLYKASGKSQSLRVC
ncbi:unnamed protein product [Polarella glacialis]|uniref:EF-hand domain-containing protein n=1 Tax=Polarella glacialis TaxID=89957 RepID=A0A813GFN4_POLGL|nr:unnamed protein product [Polarella glacialis]CAE8623762.1 unnamed protein product [Polarella glacialis]